MPVRFHLAAALLLGASAAPALAQEAFDTSDLVNEATLGTIAGREDIGSAAIADQSNTVSHNSVGDNDVTGPIQIDGNAFQNLSGLAVINANSGNNVAINAAMNVTISLTGK